VSNSPGLLQRLDRTGFPLLMARLGLGVVFIYMGWAKVSDPVEFLKLIREYQMVPQQSYVFMNVLAAVLPWMEIYCGILLITGVAMHGSALTMLVMLLAFTGVVAIRALGMYNLGQDPFCAIRFDCGCGGGEVRICRKLLENTGLILLSMIVLWSSSRRFCLKGDLIRA